MSTIKCTFDQITLTPTKQGYNIIGLDELKANVESVELNNVGGNTYAKQSIITDNGQKVLKAQVIADDPSNGGSTTRAQMSIRFLDGYNASVYHFSQRMKLHPDIEYLKNYSDKTNYPDKINWFVIYEIWNKHINTMDGDPSGSARWDLSLQKDSGVGSPLYWNLKGEYMQPSNLSYHGFWNISNKKVPIPYGKWFTLDVIFTRGGSKTGNYKITITIDGEQPIVLFDVTGSTRYPEQPNVQLKSWQPFKLYLDSKYLDWMKSHGKEISAEYSNLIWYKE